MRISKLALSVVLVSMFGVSVGQSGSATSPTPYIFSFAGVPSMVGYDLRYDFADPGSTDARKGKDKVITKLTASQNSQSLRFITEILEGHVPFPMKTAVHRGDAEGAMIGFMATGIDSMTFSETRSDLTGLVRGEWIGDFSVGFAFDPAGPLFMGSGPVSPAEAELAKADRKLKPWMKNQFHFKLNGVVDHSITGVSEIRVKSLGDLNGDGAPELVTDAPIVITMPETSLMKYLGAVGSDPTSPPYFKICWLNDAHEPFVTFMGNLEVAGWGPVDPFSSPGGPREVQVRIGRGDVGLIVDTTCSMGGPIK